MDLKHGGNRQYLKWLLQRLALVIYDVIAINAAFFLALLTRFYVAQEFHELAMEHVEAYISYAPVYTVFCLVVFYVFRLYSGMWKYAGYSDLNRIFVANIICFIGHVIGTLLLFRRMPTSFYCIGGIIQLVLVAAVRLSPRLFEEEKTRLRKNKSEEVHNAMIVGTGGTGRAMLKQLEHSESLRAVCILNYKESDFGMLLNGVPVVNGTDNMKEVLEKYRVDNVIFASAMIPLEIRKHIKDVCGEIGTQVQEYSDFAEEGKTEVPQSVKQEAEIYDVEVVIDGKSQRLSSGEELGLIEPWKYIVRSMNVHEHTLTVELVSGFHVADEQK